jgi:uncharacterized repeat protein (TIGR01451 family)
MLLLSATNAVAAVCSAPAFGSPRHTATAVPLMSGVATGDFNADGHLDVAVLQRGFTNEQKLQVLLGDGNGGFATTTIDLPAVQSLWFFHLRSAEMTGDAHLDLVTTAYESATAIESVIVLEGDGAGLFTLGSPNVLGATPYDVQLSDVDGDADADVVVVTTPSDGSSFDATVGTLLNDGSGGFSAPVSSPGGAFPSGIVTADFNGDGDVDVAIALFDNVTPANPARVEVRLGNGTGAFGPVVASRLVPYLLNVEAADFNEDGNVDVAAVAVPPTEPGGATSILLGDGAGGLGAPSTFSTDYMLFDLLAADFTGDGHLDLFGSGMIFIPSQGRSISVLTVFRGTGTATFESPTHLYPQGVGSFMSAAGDFDGDGRIDVIAAGTGPGTVGQVTLFLSMCGNVADLSLSMTDSPDPVVRGYSVTYTFTVVNHGPDPASVSFAFNVPPGMTFVSASAATGPCSPASASTAFNGIVRCALGDLSGSAPGNTSSVTVVLTPLVGGSKQGTASVMTSVADPDTGNNTDSETTLVTIPGGLDPFISVSGASTLLTWTDGDAEAGYVVWRSANGVVTRFPNAGLFPAATTSFVDGAPLLGTLNCYRIVAAAADETPLAASGTLCQMPGTASPPNALADFRLRFDGAATVRMEWSPFGGQTRYAMKAYRASAPAGAVSIVSGGASAVSVTMALGEFRCFVLIPLDGSTVLANSAALCANP